MSITASDSYKTTLLEAARTADLVYVDGDVAELCEDKDFGRDGFFRMNDPSGNRYEFKDQVIEINHGLATFDDIEGENYVIRFRMMRYMTALDLVIRKLKG